MKGALGAPPSSSSNDTNEAVFPLPYSPPAFAYQPRTPVVSVHTNSYNISTAANSSGYGATALRSEPWSPGEHQRFLDALEGYGVNAPLASPDIVWHAIAQAVHTRTLQDVKEHAHQYLVQLQYANVQKRNEHLFMQSIDASWTLEDDALFEHLLAVHGAADSTVCYPWELIASKLPGKSSRAVQERYHKLCYDIARIENGHQVEIHYRGSSARNKALATAGNAAAMSSSVSLPERAQGLDCTVTLTPEEQAILVEALEQARESLPVSPELLESVTSAVMALAKVRNKIPPQRASALFTLDEARVAIQELLSGTAPPLGREPSAQPAADAQGALELLVRRLRLQPGHSTSTTDTQDSSGSLATTGAESAKRNAGQHPKPLTTAGLAFGDASPAPLFNSMHFLSGPAKPADASQRSAAAEDLLPFRAPSSSSSSSHAGSDSTQSQLHTRQATALSSAASPYNLRSRDFQPFFSPSSSSTFPSAPLPSPLSNLVASFTPRSSEALGRSGAFVDDLGDGTSGRAAMKQEAANAGHDTDGAAMHDFSM